MRQVIESGTDFAQNHVFILLAQIGHISSELAEFLKVLLDEANVDPLEYRRFVDGL
jgi:hypothetical protein